MACKPVTQDDISATCVGKLRIDFVVRETGAGDGSEDNLRFVRFGDDTTPAGIRDFFDRCRDALCMMFGAAGSCVVVLDDPGTVTAKIQLIKVLRDATGAGLRECKETIEAGQDIALMAFVSKSAAEPFVQRMYDASARSHVRDIRLTDVVGRPANLIPLLWHDGRRL